MSDLFGFIDPRAVAPAAPAPEAVPATRTAVFSPCRVWRYRLDLEWDRDLLTMLVCMLNPSTADEHKNDPTIERLERRARAGGYGSLSIINLYAARSTDPRRLYKGADPVGIDNDRHIADALHDLHMVGGIFVCGWGAHGAKVMPERPAQVLALAADEGVAPMAFSINGDGSPQHPLYIAYDVQPVPYSGAA